MNGDQPAAIDSEVLRSLESVKTDPTGRVDLEQLAHRLSLTPAQRLEENDRFARFLSTVRDAGRLARGRNA